MNSYFKKGKGVKVFRGKSEKGSGIVEVMVAMVVLSVGMIGAAGMTYSIINGNLKSNRMSTALNLIQDKLEFFQNRININDTAGFVSDDPNPIDGAGAPGGEYTRTWSITSFTGNPDIKTITVRLMWPRQGGVTDQISLTSMVRL